MTDMVTCTFMALWLSLCLELPYGLHSGWRTSEWLVQQTACNRQRVTDSVHKNQRSHKEER
ncbi:hypothetical protein IV72_GL000267 [Atopobium minutum]|nr:hypothetical protein IV72_GL000267 [Atopobium minutum]